MSISDPKRAKKKAQQAPENLLITLSRKLLVKKSLIMHTIKHLKKMQKEISWHLVQD